MALMTTDDVPSTTIVPLPGSVVPLRSRRNTTSARWLVREKLVPRRWGGQGGDGGLVLPASAGPPPDSRSKPAQPLRLVAPGPINSRNAAGACLNVVWAAVCQLEPSQGHGLCWVAARNIRRDLGMQVAG
jgi:hypothetical protein